MSSIQIFVPLRASPLRCRHRIGVLPCLRLQVGRHTGYSAYRPMHGRWSRCGASLRKWSMHKRAPAPLGRSVRHGALKLRSSESRFVVCISISRGCSVSFPYEILKCLKHRSGGVVLRRHRPAVYEGLRFLLLTDLQQMLGNPFGIFVGSIYHTRPPFPILVVPKECSKLGAHGRGDLSERIVVRCWLCGLRQPRVQISGMTIVLM